MESLPAPPRRPAPDRKPARAARDRRRPALTKEAIVEAALKVLDSEGLDAVTMRRVAQELDTGAASLYAHVTDKEELIALLMERVIGELPEPVPDAETDWQEQIKQFGRAIRQLYTAHNDIARAAFARIPLGPNALRSAEAAVGVLRSAGLPDQVVAFASDLLPLYVTAVSYEESLYSQHDVSADDLKAFAAQMRDYFAALPADRFPNLTALADPLTAAPTGDARFEFGLEVLVRGLASMAPEP
jgi:AcrR family transcriptional regulator